MKLAKIAGIETADHSLIRTSSGQLAYLTKRFDRNKNKKMPVEDFCQLNELPSSGKYDSSMEKAGKILLKYSSTPGLDVISFFEISLFSFLTGNADMHLKNFSILKTEDNQYRLSPAYDLLSTALALPEDKEQMALTINGRKNKINRNDFEELGAKLSIDKSVIEKIITRHINYFDEFKALIEISFLSSEMKKQYIALIKTRMKVLRESAK